MSEQLQYACDGLESKESKTPMKIKNITSEYCNDFSAIMECEHCGATHKITSGYHDNFYHTQVIPAMTCEACGKNREGRVPENSNDNGILSVA